jgi:hypothetical protein
MISWNFLEISKKVSVANRRLRWGSYSDQTTGGSSGNLIRPGQKPSHTKKDPKVRFDASRIVYLLNNILIASLRS